MVASQLFRLFYGKKMQQFAGIPGPTPVFPLGNAKDLMTPLLISQILANYAKQYGDMVLFWVLGSPNLSVTSPDLIRQVLLRDGCPVHAGNFYKDLPTKALRPMLTDTSTFVAKDAGEKWQFLNRNHPFNLGFFREWLQVQITPLQAFLEERVEELIKVEKPLPAYNTIQRLTFDAFSLAMVGRVFEGDAAFQEFLTMCDSGTQRMGKSTLAQWLIKEEPDDRTYRNISKSWYDRFMRIVEDAYANPGGNSLLSWVVRHGGTEFSKEQMRSVCTEVYPGGSISAPAGITTALYLMGQPNSFQPTLEEALRALWAEPLTLDRLEGCIPLEQTLRETLRLWPPVSFFLRNVLPDCPIELGGHQIPGNTTIYASNFYLHRLGTHWGDEVDSFQPQRWDHGKLAANDYGSDYFFPFGRGDRACIGRFFALYFMRLTLAVLLQKVRLDFGSQPFSQEFYFAVGVPNRQLTARFARR